MVIDLNIYPKVQKSQQAKEINLDDLPQCYSNYDKTHTSCRQCIFQEKCLMLAHPRDPEWCNPL